MGKFAKSRSSADKPKKSGNSKKSRAEGGHRSSSAKVFRDDSDSNRDRSRNKDRKNSRKKDRRVRADEETASASSGSLTASVSSSENDDVRRQRRPPRKTKDLSDVIEREVARVLSSREAPRPAEAGERLTVNKVQPLPESVGALPAAEAAAALALAATPAAPSPAPAAALQQTKEVQQAQVEEAGTAAEVVSGTEVLGVGAEALAARKPRGRGRREGGDLGAAYTELYTQLCVRMLTSIFRYFQRLYQSSGSERKYRAALNGITTWNQLEINKRAKELTQAYPDVQTYFKYAYAANVMLMSVVVQRDENSEDVEIDVPQFSNFVHKTYIECARVLYDNPGVLDPSLPDRKRLRIREELFRCFGTAVATALRMMVPLEAIAPGGKTETYDDVELSEHSEEEDQDDSAEDEDGDEDDDEEDQEEDEDEDSEDDEDEDDEDEEDDDEEDQEEDEDEDSEDGDDDDESQEEDDKSDKSDDESNSEDEEEDEQEDDESDEDEDNDSESYESLDSKDNNGKKRR
jgi:hypothetical protein